MTQPAKAPRRLRTLLALASCLVASCSSVGCGRQENATPSASVAPAAAAVSEKLPEETKSLAHAWLAELRNAHAIASSAKGENEKRAALRELGRVFDHAPEIRRKLAAAPHVTEKIVTSGTRGSRVEVAQGEVVSLSQDLASRAARIELSLGGGAAALAWAERGLALSEEPSVLRANLLMDAADAHELSGHPALGKPFLLEALRINQRLLDEELATP